MVNVNQVEARPGAFDRDTLAEIAPRRSRNIELPDTAAVHFQRIAPATGPQYSGFHMPRASGHRGSPRKSMAVRPRIRLHMIPW